MRRQALITTILLVAGSLFAQTEVELADALFFPEEYLDREIVFPGVFAGDLFDVDRSTLGGRSFLLTLEDDSGNQVDGIGTAFIPILPRSLARQWADLGLSSLEMIRSNVYGLMYQGEYFVIFEISKVETLSAAGNVLDVIE